MRGEISPLPDGYLFRWSDHQIVIRVLRPHQSGRGLAGGLWADITVHSDRPGEAGLLHHGRMNLSSVSQRLERIRYLKGMAEDVPWQTIIEDMASRMLALHEVGEPLVNLAEGDEPPDTPYLVDMLLPEGQPTIFFGEMGTGKSLLADTLAYSVADGQEALLALSLTPGPVLYLDWETDEGAHKRTIRGLARGLSARFLPPCFYRTMSRPLADDIDQVRNKAEEVAARLIIVDSVGPACAGDMLPPEQPLEFMRALRSLGRTALCIAQTRHDNGRQKRHVFGSVMFTYLARSIWEVRSQQTSDGPFSELVVGLYHRKAFQGPLQAPIGIRFNFNRMTKAISVGRTDIRDVPELAEAATLPEQIDDVLTRPMSVRDIASELGRTEDTVRRILNRARGDRYTKTTTGLWIRIDTTR